VTAKALVVAGWRRVNRADRFTFPAQATGYTGGEGGSRNGSYEIFVRLKPIKSRQDAASAFFRTYRCAGSRAATGTPHAARRACDHRCRAVVVHLPASNGRFELSDKVEAALGGLLKTRASH
jgi:hypothetical protein